MAGVQPDWAALYVRYRDAMHRVAASVLREAGMADQANDVVQEAMTSLMSSPPANVRSGEAIMVTAAKRKAYDLLRSAAVRRAGPELGPEHDHADPADIAEEVVEQVDRQRARAVVWDGLSVLDTRHRKVAWDFVALGRSRAEVAAALGVSPSRVSQMARRALEDLRRYVEEQGGAE
jgi:RNA polymerase sigma-70 factor (ECF subfamily)